MLHLFLLSSTFSCYLLPAAQTATWASARLIINFLFSVYVCVCVISGKNKGCYSLICLLVSLCLREIEGCGPVEVCHLLQGFDGLCFCLSGLQCSSVLCWAHSHLITLLLAFICLGCLCFQNPLQHLPTHINPLFLGSIQADSSLRFTPQKPAILNATLLCLRYSINARLRVCTDYFFSFFIYFICRQGNEHLWTDILSTRMSERHQRANLN